MQIKKSYPVDVHVCKHHGSQLQISLSQINVSGIIGLIFRSEAVVWKTRPWSSFTLLKLGLLRVLRLAAHENKRFYMLGAKYYQKGAIKNIMNFFFSECTRLFQSPELSSRPQPKFHFWIGPKFN